VILGVPPGTPTLVACSGRSRVAPAMNAGMRINFRRVGADPVAQAVIRRNALSRPFLFASHRRGAPVTPRKGL
jgi:hypothetical protein